MPDTSARLLHLLSLLQRRGHWSGPELAAHLGVTGRTVRRDIGRLRTLGYPVEAGPGVGGGYELGAGGALPPLLLDDDEATAVAVALSVSAGGAVAGIEEPALSALAKLDRVLPPRVRHRVHALRGSTISLARHGDAVDAEILVTLAQACAGHERITISYRDREGRPSERRVEPYRLVATGRRWYLAAQDLDRRDWRTFRVDRMQRADRTGHRFSPVEEPDLGALVARSITTSPYRYQATVSVAAPVEVLRAKVPATVATVRADGDGSLLTAGADDLDALAGNLVALGLPFEVLQPAELRRHVHAIGQRLVRSNRPARTGRNDRHTAWRSSTDGDTVR